MNKYKSNLSYQDNIKNAKDTINQKLIQKDYFQFNLNNNISPKNIFNVKDNNNDKIINDYCSKSFNLKDNNTNKNLLSNYKKIFNYKNNKNINKNRIKRALYQISENEYIFNLAMNNLNKCQNNLIDEKENINEHISNQINNKRFTNNIINYCLINPNNNSLNNKKLNNNDYLYDMENDIILNDKNSPQPEPTPIKITKTSKNINQIKNSNLYLKQNNQINNINNSFNNNYNDNKYLNLNKNNNDNININYIGHSNNSFIYENIRNNLNNSFSDEGNKINNNLSERITSSKLNNNNNICEYKLQYILKNLNLSHLMNIFKINYVSFNDLFLLTKEDLREMKIPIGPRNKLIHFIQEYKKHMKNYEFEDLSHFFNFYKNDISISSEPKIIGNNYNSTTQTTNNEFSYRLKGNSNIYSILSNENKEENSVIDKIINNNISHDSTKENFYQNNNNYSLLNLSNNYLQTSLTKNNININNNNNNNEGNSIKNLKTNSYLNPNLNKYHKNNSVFCKEKILKHYYNNINKINNNNTNNKISYKKIYNIKKNNKKNITKTRQNIKKPLIKLIEDTQTDKSLNEQILNNKNKNKNQQKNNNIDNKKNQTKISNMKIKNNSNLNYINNIQSINNKIIENFKNLTNEVENFKKNYKKLKKASFDRENKIKNLLLEDKHSSGKINILKQQIKKLRSYKLEKRYNEYSERENKCPDKNLVLKNIGENRNNISYNNISQNNISNNKNNIFMYELNIEKNK